MVLAWLNDGASNAIKKHPQDSTERTNLGK
jgi:hypothetical protein